MDDCFFAATRDQEWIQSQVDVLKTAFEELTLERGDVINILGMTVHMERDKWRAVIKQKRFVDKLTEEFKVAKVAIMLDKDVAKVLMSMDSNYWRTYLRRDGKILVKLDKIMYGFKEAAYWWNVTHQSLPR